MAAEGWQKSANDTLYKKICDSFELQIKHVSSQIDAFRQNLRIRGVHSSIRAMVQKVKN
jgi:hypothetical protein